MGPVVEAKAAEEKKPPSGRAAGATSGVTGQGAAVDRRQGDGSQAGVVTVADNGVRIVVPLEITVRLGGSSTVGGPSSTAGATTSGVGSALQPGAGGSPEAAAAAVKDSLKSTSDVIDVRSTYLSQDGLLTDQKGVVVKVRPEASRNP
jgi:hypothetical protein